MPYKFNPITGNFDLVSTTEVDIGDVALGYTHEQGSPSDTWVIVHNLGFRPAGLEVFDSAGTINEPGDIVHNTVNQMTVTFATAFGGTAFVS